MSDDKFNDVPKLSINDDAIRFSVSRDRELIEIGYDYEPWLGKNEAQALRDWLNKVLP